MGSNPLAKYLVRLPGQRGTGQNQKGERQIYAITQADPTYIKTTAELLFSFD
jgi:hypothetical protein